MENNYNQLGENSAQRGNNFLYGGIPLLASPNSSIYGRSSGDGDDCYDQSQAEVHPTVKTEGGSTSHHHTFQYPSIIRSGYHHQTVQNHHESESSGSEVDALKAKIIAHPQCSNLLDAYMDCQKVGAPPEVVARLSAVRQEFEARQRDSLTDRNITKDPELEQFMEAYYDMLVKYREELTRPLHEAMDFMRKIETQLNMLGNGPVRIFNFEDKCEGVGSSEEEQDNSGGETKIPEIDPRAEDRELKNHLLRKYSGYLSSLKQELSKKKKKGKLPKDARQKLLSWWELHYKWPYPSAEGVAKLHGHKGDQLTILHRKIALYKESEKVALAETTGLDQKQINNWFINQRKRHWKPSEDMQFMVMDGLHPQNAAALYFEGHYMAEGPFHLGQ